MPDTAEPGESAGSGTVSDGQYTRWSRGRIRRLVPRAVLGLAIVLSVFGLAIVLACFINDRTIAEARGTSVAEVLDTSPTRTVVRFSTPDGRVFLPPDGVLYPFDLQEGQTIQVEYDSTNPDLVKVADRGAELSLLPVGSSLLGVWAVLLPIYWLLRRSIPSRN